MRIEIKLDVGKSNSDDAAPLYRIDRESIKENYKSQVLLVQYWTYVPTDSIGHDYLAGHER